MNLTKSSIASFIATFIQGRPKTSLLVALIPFFLSLIPLSQLEEDYSFKRWHHPKDPLMVQFDQYEQAFGNDDSVLIGLSHRSNILNPKSLKLIEKLTFEFWKVNSVVRVDSLANHTHVHIEDQSDEINIAPLLPEDSASLQDEQYIKKLRAQVEGDKRIEGVFVSKDQKMALIHLKMTPSYVKSVDHQLVMREVRGALERLNADDEHIIFTSGSVALMDAFKEIARTDLATLSPLLILIFCVIIYFAYRSFGALVLTFAVIINSVLMMLGTSVLFGEKINSLSIASPNILMTVALADAIHLLSAYYLARKQNYTPQKALNFTLIKNFIPTLLTTLSTAVGFLSFANAKIQPVSMMGLSVGVGVIYAWLNTYFLMGALLQLGINRKGKLSKDNATTSSDRVEEMMTPSKRTVATINFLKRNSLPVLVSSLLLTVFGLHYSQQLEVNMDPYGQFPNDYPLVTSLKGIESHMGPMKFLEIMLKPRPGESAKSPRFLQRVEAFEKWLQAQDYANQTVSVIDVIKDINQKLNGNERQFYRLSDSLEHHSQALLFYSMGLPAGMDLNDRISINDDAIRLSLYWDVSRSKEANIYMRQIRDELAKRQLNGFLTGKTPLFHDLTPYVVSTFAKSLLTALVLIFILLVWSLKSFKMGLIAMIPNTLPLILGAGVYAYLGMYVDIAGVIIASVCLGIAVDDSIHFLFEYQKYISRQYTVEEALQMVFTTTVPALVYTTLLIALGFGSFALATYIPNAKFGAMVALILSFALLADIILLPALLLFLSRKDKALKTALGVFILSAAALVPSKLFAQESQGHLSFETRSFENDNKSETFDHQYALSGTLQSEVSWSDRARFRLGLLWRGAFESGSRSFFNLNDTNILFQAQDWSLSLGTHVFNWKSLEFFTVADTLNPRNLDMALEDERLGLPSAVIKLNFNQGHFEFIPIFASAPALYPQQDNRNGPLLNLSTPRFAANDQRFDQGKRKGQFATRIKWFLSAADIELHYISKYDTTNPLFVIDRPKAISPEIKDLKVRPYYFMVEQYGASTQIPLSDFMLKMEAARFEYENEHVDFFVPFSGVRSVRQSAHTKAAIGMEYAHDFSNGQSARFLFEYVSVFDVDSSQAQRLGAFQRDAMIGLKHHFNDFNSHELSLFAIHDVQHFDETIFALEHQFRVKDSWKLITSLNSINAPKPDENDLSNAFYGLRPLRESDNISIKLTRFF